MKLSVANFVSSFSPQFQIMFIFYHQLQYFNAMYPYDIYTVLRIIHSYLYAGPRYTPVEYCFYSLIELVDTVVICVAVLLGEPNSHPPNRFSIPSP